MMKLKEKVTVELSQHYDTIVFEFNDFVEAKYFLEYAKSHVADVTKFGEKATDVSYKIKVDLIETYEEDELTNLIEEIANEEIPTTIDDVTEALEG